MKKILFGVAFLCAFILTSFLTSCSASMPPWCPLPSCQLNTECSECVDLLHETWLCKFNLDPNVWARCADPWFVTGKPNLLERSILKAPMHQVVTRMAMRVPSNFTHIKVNGGFQVQIIGGADHNSVTVIGPNAGARRVGIEVRKCTLLVHETESSHEPCGPLDSVEPVIVRIHVKNLHSITNSGCGHVFGRYILSNGLVINSSGRGKIMLAGDMNLTHVNQIGCGTVIVYGANTPCLSIKALGNGIIKLTGRVGIQCIINKGRGKIKILGADTDSLVIHASGRSCTSIVGYANVRLVNATEFARVFLYWVNACDTRVIVCDHARVGLAGVTQNLNVDVRKKGIFWGGHLHAHNVYIQTKGHSHGNVFAERNLFASACNDSSIYYGGRPKEVSRFYYDKARILSLSSNASCAPCTLPVFRPRC